MGMMIHRHKLNQNPEKRLFEFEDKTFEIKELKEIEDVEKNKKVLKRKEEQK